MITEPSIGPGSPNSVDFIAVSARIENLASWFAASVLVAAGVIYALKLEDDRPRSNSVRLPPRATPAIAEASFLDGPHCDCKRVASLQRMGASGCVRAARVVTGAALSAIVSPNKPGPEPPRVRWRPFGLSHAAMAGCSGMA